MQQRKSSFQHLLDNPIRIFISYASEDRKEREEFERKCLSDLVGSQIVEVWHTDMIRPGANSKLELSKQLEICQLFIPLISSNYVSCYSLKLETIYLQVNQVMQRINQHSIFIIPVLLTDISWINSPFENLQWLPRNGEPVDSQRWGKRSKALHHVAREIKTEIERVSRNLRQV